MSGRPSDLSNEDEDRRRAARGRELRLPEPQPKKALEGGRYAGSFQFSVKGLRLSKAETDPDGGIYSHRNLTVPSRVVLGLGDAGPGGMRLSV